MKTACICFDDIRDPRNGYAIRCKMLVQDLASKSKLTVYQLTTRSNQAHYAGANVTSFDVQTVPRSAWHKFITKYLGVNPLFLIAIQLRTFRHLYARRHDLKQNDQVYIEGCLLIVPFLVMRALKVPIVMDTHCMNKDVALKLKQHQPLIGTIRVILWHLLENYQLNRSARIIYVSEPDHAFANQHYGVDHKSSEIIPNTVSAPDIKKYQAAAQALRRQLLSDHETLACMIGDLGAIHNKMAADFIEKELAPLTPHVQYVVVGSNPDQRSNQSNLTFTGFVDSIDPYIIAADLCIAPLAIGSGTKTKVLDYLKYHKPVLTTPVGAEGIDNPGDMIIEPLDAFPARIKELLGVTA